jgi:hypothetical protein
MADEIVTPQDFYVYLHRKATTGEVFYVGKGRDKRAWTHKSRNVYWHRVAKKHGVLVEILRDGLQEWAALELEIDYIALYGRKSTGFGPLINLTDGGDNPPHTPESIAASVEKRRKNPVLQEKLRARLAEMHKDPEWQAKFRAMTTARAQNETWNVNVRIALKKRTQDPSWRASVKAARTVQVNNPKWIGAVRKACNKPVLCVETGMVFSSAVDAVKWLGVSNPKTAVNGLSRACKDPAYTSYGYHWRFTNNPI